MFVSLKNRTTHATTWKMCLGCCRGRGDNNWGTEGLQLWCLSK